MKNLAYLLDEIYAKAEKRVNKTYTKYNNLSLVNISPYDIPKYLKDNNVPRDCFIDTVDLSDGRNDDWLSDGDFETVVTWKTTELKSQDQIEKDTIKAFNTICFYHLGKHLKENGYVRNSVRSDKLPKTVDFYKCNLEGDFQSIENYMYSYFSKK